MKTQIKRHMRLKSLQEHGLLPLEPQEQATCRHLVEQEQDQDGAWGHPFIAMRQDLRYRGRGQKIDSLWRK